MLIMQTPGLLLLELIPLTLTILTVVRALSLGWTIRRSLGMLLRCAALGVLILATAQPEWQRNASHGSLTLLVDVSASISPADRAAEAVWLQRAAAHASDEDPVTVIAFAGTATATTFRAPVSRDMMPALLRPRADRAETDLAGALRLAAGLASPGTRLILVSDGIPTAGDASAVLPDLTARHLTLDTVLLDHQQPDTAITRLSVPPSILAGTNLPVQITLNSTRAVTATLTVRVDGQNLGSQALDVQVGDNPYQISLPAQDSGWHVIRASVTAPGDAVPDNNILSAVTDVTRIPRVLLVAQRPASTAALAQLKDPSLDSVATLPGRMPASIAKLSQYDGIILDDLSATALTGAQVNALDAAVRTRGIGLFVLGGTHSLTQGHYSQSALERILPVLSDTPASLQDGNVALQLVLDRSGSMDDLAGDVPKIVMSRAAARLAADFAIQHQDSLGLLAFDQASHILVPMGKVATADTTHINQIINGMFSDGGTNIYQALQVGIEQVSRSGAPYRHIILMTDGRSDPANYQPLLREAQQRKATISTVALGPDADVQLLRSIATSGKGRFYYTTNARDLPHIFAEETRLAAGSAAVTGDIGVHIATNSPTVRSLGAGSLPHLGGYTATVLKPEAVNDLATNVQNRKPDPLLARWQYGLGRVLVWTPGLENAWSASWRRAEPSFWTDALHWTLRGPAIPEDAPSLGIDSPPSAITIDTLRNSGVAAGLQRLTIDVHAPDGNVAHITATQTGPGLYSAAYPFTTSGVYAVAVRPLGGSGGNTSALLAVPYNREYLPTVPNVQLLSTLSAATGGKTLHNPGGFTVPHSGGHQSSSLWWPLALLALALFVGAVGAGRAAEGRSSPSA